MQRIFVAIEVSDEVKQLVQAHIAALQRIQGNVRVSWVGSEKLHLTLKFFGDVEDDVFEGIVSSVVKAAENTERFEFAIAGTGVFPNKRRPSVLWFGVRDEDALLAGLKSELDHRLKEIGIQPDERPFRPHLTLARLRQTVKSGSLVKSHLASTYNPIVVNATRIVIFESRLENTGAVHTERFSANLGRHSGDT